MVCVSRLVLSHIWTHGTARGMDGRVGGQLRQLVPQTCSLDKAVQVQRWNLHLTGVALGAASQSGDGTTLCPSESCVSTLGLGVGVPLGVPCVL